MRQKIVNRSVVVAQNSVTRAALLIIFCMGFMGFAMAAIDAAPVALGSASEKTGKTLTLSWQPPVSRADGTTLPLDQIRGYHIGVTAVDESEKFLIRISDPLMTETTLTGLTGHRYNFDLIAVDSNGQESPAVHLETSFN